MVSLWEDKYVTKRNYKCDKSTIFCREQIYPKRQNILDGQIPCLDKTETKYWNRSELSRSGKNRSENNHKAQTDQKKHTDTGIDQNKQGHVQKNQNKYTQTQIVQNSEPCVCVYFLTSWALLTF